MLPKKRAFHHLQVNTQLVHLLLEKPSSTLIMSTISHNDRVRELLEDAVREGRIETVKELLEEFDVRQIEGDSLLYPAVANNDLPMMKLLLEHGAEVNACDGTGQSVLLKAVIAHCRVDLVKYLLDAGANPDSSTDLQRTILHEAVYRGNAEVIGAILSRDVDLHGRHRTGRNALHFAAYSNVENLEVVDFLLKRGVDLNAKERLTGNTPLILAVRHGKSEMVSLLIKSGADVNAESSDGYTSLQYACIMKAERIAEMLLQGGATLTDKASQSLMEQLATWDIASKILDSEDSSAASEQDLVLIMIRRLFARQLKTMKAMRVYNDVTCLQLMTNKAERLAPLFRNKVFLSALALLDRQQFYPIFSVELTRNLEAAEACNSARSKMEDHLNEAFENRLPGPAMDNIIRYLTPEDIPS